MAVFIMFLLEANDGLFELMVSNTCIKHWKVKNYRIDGNTCSNPPPKKKKIYFPINFFLSTFHETNCCRVYFF